jgi:flagellar biogenesis protein FliO
MMKTMATENIVIGTLAGIGLVVLLVLFVYVVKRIMRDE